MYSATWYAPSWRDPLGVGQATQSRAAAAGSPPLDAVAAVERAVDERGDLDVARHPVRRVLGSRLHEPLPDLRHLLGPVELVPQDAGVEDQLDDPLVLPRRVEAHVDVQLLDEAVRQQQAPAVLQVVGEPLVVVVEPVVVAARPAGLD